MGIIVFKKILIAIDGSENSKKAAVKGMEIAEQNGSDICVLYVIDSNIVEDIVRVQRKDKSEIIDQLEEKAKIYVKDIQRLCETRSIECKILIKRGRGK